MDWEALKEATKISISEILETMFFLPVEPSDHEGGDDLSENLKAQSTGASLKFSGPIVGKVSVSVPVTLARSMTADFLGQEDADVGTDEIEGTVKELLNMATGKALSLFDEKAVFKLGIPEINESEDPLNGFSTDHEEGFTLVFNIFEHQLALEITIQS